MLWKCLAHLFQALSRGEARLIAHDAFAIADVCEAYGVDLPTVAMAYPLLHPAVTAVALGMRSPEEVDQNVARATIGIPAALWTALADAGLVPPTPR